ncbi:MAG: D-aminoacylase [Planctomycetota bacterium]|nr:D-aminoacylase [Planctomycetota bacterium]
MDGTGAVSRRGDVGVVGDRIAAVGDLSGARAARILDVEGLHVVPGFIDAHSHATAGLSSLDLSGAEPLLVQGVTTVVVNVDGGGPVDLVEQRRALEEHGLGVNVVRLVPFGSIRRQVLGQEDRAPTQAELERMKALVRSGMQAGAFGLSTGLYYAPQSYAATEEVIELARVAAEHGGVYHSHIRDEADYNVGLVAAVDEVIRIAREARLVGVISHVKALGPRVWGLSTEVVRHVEEARAAGIEVVADQYPYAASSTSLTGALVPRWALEGGRKELLARLGDPEVRARIRGEMLENLDRRGGAERLRFTGREGRTLAAVARERGLEPVDAAMDVIAEGSDGVISFNMQAEDVRRFMRQPWTMTSSDGGLVRRGTAMPHPRNYGTFPRKIRLFVVEEKVLDLESAIHSMTGLPARVFGLSDRGAIRPGGFADIAVFDLARFQDVATYEDPHRLAEGMVHVLVNGSFAIEHGRPTGILGGRVLAPMAPPPTTGSPDANAGKRRLQESSASTSFSWVASSPPEAAKIHKRKQKH